jgi:acyl dehydratase
MVNIGDKFIEHFEVSKNVHEGFISTFGDCHRLHTDRQFAVARGFRSEVMHGNILNGFLSYFVGMCLPVPEVIILSQEIKFQRPVYLDDKLVLEVLVHDIHPSVNVVELSCKFRNLTDNKVVASAKISVGETSESREI